MRDDVHIALYCDWENLALGASQAGLPEFDARSVIERLLRKGDVTVRRAYCDWSRFQSDRAALHEAGFELIEVPSRRVAGKNSADIRLVVDAMDLCAHKPHIGTFALASGDSDFSPLAQKLRENGRTVLGIGVRGSTSDLLVHSCDEFIYYRDVIDDDGAREETLRMVVGLAGELLRDRGGPVQGSVLKQAVRRKQRDFDESALGYRNFSALLRDAAERERLALEEDPRAGGYLVLDAV